MFQEVTMSVVALKRIAFRNLARHKVKSIITIIAITISVAIYILMDGWLAGINIESKRNIVAFETGAAKIQAQAYVAKKEELPMYENFGNWEQYASELDTAGFNYAPRFTFTGTLYAETGSAPMEFFGIDPVLESNVLRYGDYVETGRFIKPGAFEMVVGTMAAEKLRIGIPMRPTQAALNEILEPFNEADRQFINSLYEPLQTKKRLYSQAEPEPTPENKRLVFKNDNSEHTKRYWNLLAEQGRMDTRISTVIDIKAAPETIRTERFETDIKPHLTAEEFALFQRCYEFDSLTNAYYLITDDSADADAMLDAFVRIDYAGAIRHVNQLIDVVIVGVINSPDVINNGYVGYLPLDVLSGDDGLMTEGALTEILIRKKGAFDTDLPGADESPEVIKAALSHLDPALDVYGWEVYVADYLAVSGADNVSTMIIIFLLFVLSFLGIANTMLMAILERTKEIGMMRALGMTEGQLILTYSIESGLIGLIGSLIGVAIGCALNIPMVKYGIDFSALIEQMEGDFGYRITGLFRSAWNIPVIIGSGIAATMLSAIVAYIPSRRAVSLPITESLRFE
ncbi:putative ABC transport system permease protein [Pillotina sp. SPG140]|jgi:ABC-type lipoprotein release transport system permease subunit